MPSLTGLTNAQSATSIGERIALKPTSITITRNGSALPAQTVRLETLASQRAVVGAGGVTFQCDAYLLGYKNHPTVADSNIQAGDRFKAGGVSYEVIIILPAHVDCLQAYLVVRG